MPLHRRLPGASLQGHLTAHLTALPVHVDSAPGKRGEWEIARIPVKPNSTEFHTVRGLPLAVHRWGDPANAKILFHHGFLDHGRSFAPIAQKLVDTWEVLALDARGHGESAWVGEGGYYHFADFWHDLDVILQSYGPVHLVGHSMGGMISAVVAAIRPQQVLSLALLDGMGPPEMPIAAWPDRLTSWLDALQVPGYTGDLSERRASRRPMPNVEEAAKRLQKANPRLPAEMALRLAQTNTEMTSEGVVWRHDPLHKTPSSRPFRTDEAMTLWARLQMPVLSIYADHSEWLPPDLAQRHAQVPHLHAGVLANASHNLHHEQPDLLAEMLRSWFLAPGKTLPVGLRPGEP